jgi:ribosome-associated translation inhibitor RaiA
MIRAGIRNSRGPSRWLPQAAVVAALIGCATPETGPKAPTPRADFIEYRQIVAQSMTLMDATLHSLDEISVQAHRDPHPAYAAFAQAVHRLEVDSIKVRARVHAMRARGDAYFEHWEEYLSTVKNKQVRELAEEHRPELKQSFEQLHLAATQIREGFRPFLSDLQKLRAVLEADPSLAHIDAQKGLILAAKDKGRQVQQGLDRILAEMNSMAALLRPPGTAARH